MNRYYPENETYSLACRRSVWACFYRSVETVRNDCGIARPRAVVLEMASRLDISPRQLRLSESEHEMGVVDLEISEAAKRELVRSWLSSDLDHVRRMKRQWIN
jgi:hypothetical protein